ncbi:hypothetical protein FNV43_RR22963 [Rhamnella rubrinervis]|uniref:Uncharacterized protein n=1 Tax=Rhamnella rubrinervis TaxID=2594499 RepID=A0A8K0DW85_9ROSA|nr:hypothetical protein FNV43_RR22963 [Rhamnella rubrinervis]
MAFGANSASTCCCKFFVVFVSVRTLVHRFCNQRFSALLVFLCPLLSLSGIFVAVAAD